VPHRLFASGGFGLATAQRIVHRHGVRIRAEGTVGVGATFRFTLAAREVGRAS
jgi:signal transduction histidine kinase